MFDTVYVQNGLLGLGAWGQEKNEAAWQTKDLGEGMMDYRITAAGELLVDRGSGDPRRKTGQSGWTRVFWHGYFRFYGDHGTDWLVFRAKFTDGLLQEIVRVEEGSEDDWTMPGEMPETPPTAAGDGLFFEIKEITYGWIRFGFRAGGQSYHDSFSSVFDPLPDLRAWLEALAVGVERAGFTWDPEGPYVRFEYQDTDRNGQGVFTVYQEAWQGPDWRAKAVFRASVGRRELVRAVYEAFTEAAASPGYDPFHWEGRFVWEPLCERFGMGRDGLTAFLATMDKGGVTGLLDWAHRQLDRDGGGQPEPEEEAEGNWAVLNGYDGWTPEKRAECLEWCIADCGDDWPYGGSRLSAFSSPIIDPYLGGIPW